MGLFDEHLPPAECLADYRQRMADYDVAEFKRLPLEDQTELLSYHVFVLQQRLDALTPTPEVKPPVVLTTTVSGFFAKRLDGYAKRHRLANRSEAIRRLIEEGTR